MQWDLIGDEIVCDSLPVARLIQVNDHWEISGDPRYRFTSRRSAFYFVMDMCV